MSEDKNYNNENTAMNGMLFAVICGVLFLSVIAFGAVDIWALGFLSIVSALMLLIFGLDSLKRNALSISTNLLQIPVMGLILIGLVQLLPLRSGADVILEVDSLSSLSFAPYSTRFAIIQLFVYFVFLAISLVVVNNEKRVRKLVYIIIVFGSLMAFFGILQRLASTNDLIYGLRLANQATPFGPFINQHHFAAFMEMTIALPLALLFGKATKSDKRALLVIAVVLMGMAIVFTSSRGGLLSLIVVLGFIIGANMLDKPSGRESRESPEGFTIYRRNFVFVGSGIAIIAVIVGIVLMLGSDSTISRIAGMQGSAEEISSGRTHFWSIAWKIFLDHPVIGSGLDSFGIVFPAYDTWSGNFRIEQAHNDYLQILSDAGILGFLCIGFFIYFLFRQSLKTIVSAENRFMRNVAIGALAGCSGILVHSFFDFPLRTPSNSFFFLILAVLATTNVGAKVVADRRKKTDQT